MSNKTITKNFAFVIFLINLCCLFAGCFSVASSDDKNANKPNKISSANYDAPQVVGMIKTDEITESSGIAASKCQENVFWTHNDSGDGAFIFAINGRGEKLGTFKVKAAKNVDWEDIAAFKDANGECFLYIGDIGNNVRVRGEFVIYLVKEPRVSESDKTSNKKNPSKTETAQAVKFDYPEIKPDAETLFVHPQTADIYILTKRLSGAAGVYKLSKDYNLNRINRLEKVADFTVPAVPNGFLTGGDISADGKRIVVCDYFSAYEIVLPEKSKNFDDIWKQKPEIIQLGERAQGEAVCYAAGGESIFATSEKENSPLIRVRRK
ncbi:MAG: hypothetical protein H0X49_16375 [Acidobacteria bacterium]|nr:hypothetical protein [Acidobacteriota bacterium]MBA4185566.1 hypothetical protein [Acidobacteriota bacterium]